MTAPALRGCLADNISLQENDLATDVREVMDGVRRDFGSYGHYPSPDMLLALADIPATIFRILEGKAEPKMYLSGLDAGVGKTTVLRHTLNYMRKHGIDAGAVICLGRLEQIERMITELGLEPGEYACLVAKNQRTSTGELFTELGLGIGRATEAQFLFTTHAMVETRLAAVQARSWEALDAFWYRNHPRQLRLWDEAVEVRQPVALDEGDIMGLAAVLPVLRNNLFQFVRDMHDAKPGSVLTVPDFEALCSQEEVWSMMGEEKRLEMAPAVRRLWFLAGRPVLVRKGQYDNMVIQYQPNLPPDILPLLVLDASARVRATYRQQDRADHNIVWLKDCAKEYQQVTVHLARWGGGKAVLKRDFNKRIAQICEVLQRHPDKRALVIHPKPGKHVPNVEAAVKARMGAVGPAVVRAAEVRFMHWGIHTSINDFADCNLVILATVYREPDAVVEALGRAAADRPIEQEYAMQEMAELIRGERLHHLLQGISRGSLRLLDGSQAQACDVYMMAHDYKTLAKDLEETLFPYCTVIDGWQLERNPEPMELTPRGKIILGYVEGRLKAGASGVSPAAIAEATGIDKANIAKILRTDNFQIALDLAGFWIQPGKGRAPSMIRRKDVFAALA